MLKNNCRLDFDQPVPAQISGANPGHLVLAEDYLPFYATDGYCCYRLCENQFPGVIVDSHFLGFQFRAFAHSIRDTENCVVEGCERHTADIHDLA